MPQHHRRSLVSLFLLAIILVGCTPPAFPPSTPTPQPGVKLENAPVAAPTSAAPIIASYEFAEKQAALGWNPTNDLAKINAGQDGLRTSSTGSDPYMVGPALRLDAASTLHLEIRMRHDKGSDAQLFWERAGKNFNEADSQHFATTPDNEWHTYRITLKDHPGWQGQITRLRLDPTTQQGASIDIAYIRALGALPASLEAVSFGPSVAIAVAGKPFEVNGVVANRGDQAAEAVTLWLGAPEGVTAKSVGPLAFPTIAAGESVTATWSVTAPGGSHALALTASDRQVGKALAIVEDATPLGKDAAILAGDQVLLTFARNSFGYGPGWLMRRVGSDWQAAGRIRSLGQIVYLDGGGNERQAAFFAPEAEMEGVRLAFAATHRDEDGTTWTAAVRFETQAAAPWITASYELSADAPVRLLSWSGPELYIGEGMLFYRRDSAMFPGLEFLLGDELSSGTDYVDASVATRYVPHPNKVTIPLMAVSGDGTTAGLMWDPLLQWDSSHDRPAALFASPNRWEGQANNLMRLFSPGMTAGLQENEDRLTKPYLLAAGETLRLSAKLFAAPASDMLAPLELWHQAYGMPAVQPRPRPDEESAALSLRNYTEITWVAAEKGWHYALHDPWGPGSNPAIALHLWVSTLDGGPPADTAMTWRDMALSSADTPPAGGQPNPWFYKPLWLMHTGGHAGQMQQVLKSALDIAGRQNADASWSYTPNAAAQRTFGKPGDSSNGYVSTFAFPVLYMARLTGDPQLVEAGRKALDYLEQQPLRPEGAQTWELSLHMPDLLASAWVTQSFVEGYRLTGEPRYLDLAQRWALAGLPFVYLWNAPDRDIMRYTTIPVFGASNYIYPWFGRPVMWNGLDYAIGLQSLADELDASGKPLLLDWRRIAEGITVATAQMQPEEGLYLGMYPDAWDVVAGTEAYTWWLAPSYLTHNLLLGANDEGTEVHTRILNTGDGRVHVSAPGAILAMEDQQGTLVVKVRYHAGETASIPEDSTASFAPLAASWSFSGGLLMVRIPFGESAEAEVQVDLAN